MKSLLEEVLSALKQINQRLDSPWISWESFWVSRKSSWNKRLWAAANQI